MTTQDGHGESTRYDDGGTTQRVPHDLTGADEAFGNYRPEPYGSGATTVTAPRGADGDLPDQYDDPYDVAPQPKPKQDWHAGADFGLLVLRLTIGTLFVGHGVMKLFGWLHGPGLDGTEKMLAGFGFTHTAVLAWVNGVTEIAGGVLVGLGLFTPVGACALAALMASAIVVRANTGVFAAGVELEIAYGAAAIALLFAGPGRISMDRHTPWYRNASAFGLVFLVIGAAASVGILLGFR